MTEQVKKDIIAIDKVKKLLDDKGGNKSAVIRQLHADGYKNSVIARSLGVRNQMVSNVLRADAQKKEDQERRALLEKK